MGLWLDYEFWSHQLWPLCPGCVPNLHRDGSGIGVHVRTLRHWHRAGFGMGEGRQQGHQRAESRSWLDDTECAVPAPGGLPARLYLPPFGMIRHFLRPPLLAGLLSWDEFKQTSSSSSMPRNLGLPLRWSHAGVTHFRGNWPAWRLGVTSCPQVQRFKSALSP